MAQPILEDFRKMGDGEGKERSQPWMFIHFFRFMPKEGMNVRYIEKRVLKAKDFILIQVWTHRRPYLTCYPCPSHSHPPYVVGERHFSRLLSSQEKD